MGFSTITGFFTYGAITSLALQTSILSSDLSNYLLPIPDQQDKSIKAIDKPEQVQPLKPIQTESLQVQTPETNTEKLTQCLRRVRNIRTSQSSSFSSSTTLLTDTGSGISATGARNQTTRHRPSQTISNNSNNNRASCTQGGCNTNYPQAARQRRIEGRVQVAVDTDEKGNVTNVRLLRSSGNQILDEATLRQARGWKLKPSPTGRQGVSIATEYSVRGSCRFLELQELR
ncbi:MAG TPA: energy transducer TonB [Leptolyngbyaceae cyanobacterium]